MATREDHQPWTKAEREAIERAWPDLTDFVLPGRTAASIASEAWRMGLRKREREAGSRFTTRPVNSVFDYADALRSQP